MSLSEKLCVRCFSGSELNSISLCYAFSLTPALQYSSKDEKWEKECEGDEEGEKQHNFSALVH